LAWCWTVLEKLGLSEDQMKMIYRVLAKYEVQVEQIKTQMQQLKKEETAELEKVLTAAQKARLQEIRSGGAKDKDRAKEPDKFREKDSPPKDKDE
jgi:hypothetical protein